MQSTHETAQVTPTAYAWGEEKFTSKREAENSISCFLVNELNNSLDAPWKVERGDKVFRIRVMVKLVPA
jgi:hypothetical protein